jgi:glycogen(starch) synthase
MRVLMLGWEFPPYISGGLGTACRGLTDAMGRLQTRILFVLPRAVESVSETGSIEEVEPQPTSPHPSNRIGHTSANLETVAAPSELTNPYGTTTSQPTDASSRESTQPPRPGRNNVDTRKVSSVRVMGTGGEDGYDGDLTRKIFDYADRCVGLTRRELFDIIHAHDWMTFPAAMAIAEFSGRPFVVHIHATEFDRSGETVNPAIFDIERRGMLGAARVIAVSERTKQTIVNRYGVPPEKVSVVHNGIEFDRLPDRPPRAKSDEKVVLFLGRITMQKGPEYFVRAAARVAERNDNVKFVIAGAGDQLPRIVSLVKELDLEDRVEFTGFLRGPDVDRAYQRADVYAMPSVSEPFGLTALEAARQGVPVVLSNTSGAAEVLRRGSLKADYWDVEMMAKMITAVLRHPGLADTLRNTGAAEISGLTWDEAARKCIRFYHDVLSRAAGKIWYPTAVTV